MYRKLVAEVGHGGHDIAYTFSPATPAPYRKFDLNVQAYLVFRMYKIVRGLNRETASVSSSRWIRVTISSSCIDAAVAAWYC